MVCWLRGGWWMPEMLGDVLMLMGAVGLTMVTCLLVERIWPTGHRQLSNELLMWQLSILGAVYAIILGFMLYTVWNDFQTAKQNVASEANALVDLARLSDGLPAAQRREIRRLTEDYAQTMIQTEWPAMEREVLPPESHVEVKQMWTTLESVTPEGATQTMLLDHALQQMSSLTEHRRVREVEVFDRLPEMLWVVLLSGAILVIFWSCMFGAVNRWMHASMVGSLAFLVVLMLLTIAEIDRPFQGSLRVPIAPFQRAAASLAE